MPSRAVERKKARREAKRKKLASAPIVVEPAKNEGTSALPPPTSEFLNDAIVERKRPREELILPSESLTRKERRKLETERKLERHLGRLEAQRARLEHGGQPSTVKLEFKNDQDVEVSTAVKEAPLRHDPRFVNGTFWRDRKEKRARTLFLGGIPAKNFTKLEVEELITSTLRKDPAAQEYLKALSSESSLFTDIDYLPLKHDAKVRNLYVTLASVPLAGCLASRLDGMPLGGKKLRCNFAADKSQRAEAIRRRG